MKVIVLGAGLLGVTSAYFLRQQGHDVTVIDRQATPAAETSFANGGQISVSHAEPWANPSAPLKVLKWLGKEDAPLLFRVRADMRQWLWGLQFLRECTPARTRHNIEQIVRLGTYSRDMLQALRRDIGIEYDQRTEGILNYIILIDGQFAGTWRRTLKKNAVIIELKPFIPFPPAIQQALSLAVDRYAAFLGLPAVLK